VGFSAPDKFSISGFIETPAATGAMAVATAGPVWIILEFERVCGELRPRGATRGVSLGMFLAGYAGFLVCNVDAYPDLHYGFVALFITGFVLHSYLRVCDNRGTSASDVAAKVVIAVGILAFLILGAMLIWEANDSLAFWAIECLGFTMLVLFTPLELIGARRQLTNRSAKQQLAGRSAKQQLACQSNNAMYVRVKYEDSEIEF
jgi:peptidoglycan/LPS O-acetylase OafA/YrhL